MSRDKSGSLLVFGGPYSNLHALDALIVEAGRRGIPRSRIVSTGDLVAYCADAKGVVARIRETGVRFVQGNCEEQIAAGAADCGCGFAPGGACDRLSADWFSHAMRQLDADDRDFLGSAPKRLDFTLNGLKIAAIHGAATQINRFVFASTPRRIKAHDLDLLGADVVVAGHSGLPFTQSVGGRLWHNAGALGMPANDGTPRVWFSILSPGEAPGSLVIEHCALDYDAAGAAAAMARAGLAPDYARTLVDGLWPNCDALPPAEATQQGRSLAPVALSWARGEEMQWPAVVASAEEPGGRIALAPFKGLETLWINTGTLCNLACAACYIESSPRNDRLAYFARTDLARLLDEIERDRLPTRQIGFTGGEPFMNAELPAMLADALERDFSALVLTNAMKPMMRRHRALLALKERFGARLALRVSLDHYTCDLHELERGEGSFAPAIEGLRWLAQNGFCLSVAGRLFSGESESIARGGYARLFSELGAPVDAASPDALILFPEMDAAVASQAPTERCWSATGKRPEDMMCATSRMAVKRKGETNLSVVACTLLPHEPAFDFGATLREAARDVSLGHPYCAQFCVYGGGSCAV
jgi:predicted phosphodiesterase/uncharacterized Fe-S cluster-containing radical SAM superfamily protein